MGTTKFLGVLIDDKQRQAIVIGKRNWQYRLQLGDGNYCSRHAPALALVLLLSLLGHPELGRLGVATVAATVRRNAGVRFGAVFIDRDPRSLRQLPKDQPKASASQSTEGSFRRIGIYVPTSTSSCWSDQPRPICCQKRGYLQGAHKDVKDEYCAMIWSNF